MGGRHAAKRTAVYIYTLIYIWVVDCFSKYYINGYIPFRNSINKVLIVDLRVGYNIRVIFEIFAFFRLTKRQDTYKAACRR